MGWHAELSGLVLGSAYSFQSRRAHIRKVIGHFYTAMSRLALSPSEGLVLKKINRGEHPQPGNALEEAL